MKRVNLNTRFIQNLYQISNILQQKFEEFNMSNRKQPFDRFKHAVYPYARWCFYAVNNPMVKLNRYEPNRTNGIGLEFFKCHLNFNVYFNRIDLIFLLDFSYTINEDIKIASWQNSLLTIPFIVKNTNKFQLKCIDIQPKRSVFSMN